MGGEALDYVLTRYLWMDDPWIERSGPDTCTYWQHRLPQHIELRELEDGVVRLRSDTVVVRDVGDEDVARDLCMRLNEYTAGWSFALGQDRAIHALCAITAPLNWDRFLSRFSDCAILSAWFGDRMAATLAAHVKGTPAYSYPSSQSGLRPVPDAVYATMDAVRERPEWVFDPSEFFFADPEDLGAFMAERMGAVADDVDVTGTRIRISTMDTAGAEPSHIVECGFVRSGIFGEAWRSQVIFPGLCGSAAPEVVSSIIWECYLDSRANLLGGWTTAGQDLVLQQLTPTLTIRGYEKLESFSGWQPDILWGLTSTLSDGIGIVVGAAPDIEAMRPSTRRASTDAMLAEILDSISDGVLDAVQDIPTPDTDRADRRLLWLVTDSTLVTAYWFNPMGPTISTLELVRSGVDTDPRTYLVEFMRHPFRPRYRALAAVDPDTLDGKIREAVSEVLTGSVPNAITFQGCPEELLPLLQACVRDAIVETAQETDTDLRSDAAQIAATRGDPWKYVGVDEEVLARMQQVDLGNGDPYEQWLEQASDLDNVTANQLLISQPWDGAMNYQLAHGNIQRGYFDGNPIFITYSTIGSVDVETEDATSP